MQEHLNTPDSPYCESITVSALMYGDPETREQFYRLFYGEQQHDQDAQKQGPKQDADSQENTRREERNEEIKKIVRRRHQEDRKFGRRP